MRQYTFSGPANGLAGGPTAIIAANEAEARHRAMVERHGEPNGRPCQDTDGAGRYLSAGLSLITVKDVRR